jgi:hypothetical protein
MQTEFQFRNFPLFFPRLAFVVQAHACELGGAGFISDEIRQVHGSKGQWGNLSTIVPTCNAPKISRCDRRRINTASSASTSQTVSASFRYSKDSENRADQVVCQNVGLLLLHAKSATETPTPKRAASRVGGTSYTPSRISKNSSPRNLGKSSPTTASSHSVAKCPVNVSFLERYRPGYCLENSRRPDSRRCSMAHLR